jgi:hypothetical protein
MALLWTQRPDARPAGRIFPAMTFDASRDRVVLFGGQVAGGTNAADTWSWDGAEWTHVGDTGPDPRYTPARTFDVAAQRVLVVGGLSGPPTQAELADSWAWDGAVWTEVAHFGPAAAMAGSPNATDTPCCSSAVASRRPVRSCRSVPPGSGMANTGPSARTWGPRPGWRADLRSTPPGTGTCCSAGRARHRPARPTSPSSATHGRPSIPAAVD